MGRKTETVVIAGESRDTGKSFLVTEMSARQAEAWAFRAFGAMVQAGIDIPLDVIASGMAGLSMVGLKAFLAAPWDSTSPLLDELMACVQVVTEASDVGGSSIMRALIDRGEEGDDIEETSTRVRLRDEVLRLHTGFSIADALLTGVSAIQSLLFPTSPTTPTPED